MAVIAREPSLGEGTLRFWMRCVNCHTAVVRQGGVSSPATLPLSVPLGVTGVELDAWQEVRACLSVGAFTSAVMMARKLLLHVAVSHGMEAKGENGHAPTFKAAVDHLLEAGIITSKMRPWIDRIKDVGNEANHEITPVTQQVGMDVAKFMEQLLRLAYEMDALIAGGSSETDQGHDASEATT